LPKLSRVAQNNRPRLATIHHPVVFADQPDSQPSADFLKSRLGGKLQGDRFDGDGRAWFVFDPEKSNRLREEFAGSLTRVTGIDSRAADLRISFACLRLGHHNGWNLLLLHQVVVRRDIG
jgi:hypothetical protein